MAGFSLLNQLYDVAYLTSVILLEVIAFCDGATRSATSIFRSIGPVGKGNSTSGTDC